VQVSGNGDEMKDKDKGVNIGKGLTSFRGKIGWFSADIPCRFTVNVEAKDNTIFGGLTDLPDSNDPSTSPAAASGSLSPSVYSPWDVNRLETRAYVERRGERGGEKKYGPRSPYCGP